MKDLDKDVLPADVEQRFDNLIHGQIYSLPGSAYKVEGFIDINGVPVRVSGLAINNDEVKKFLAKEIAAAKEEGAREADLITFESCENGTNIDGVISVFRDNISFIKHITWKPGIGEGSWHEVHLKDGKILKGAYSRSLNQLTNPSVKENE